MKFQGLLGTNLSGSLDGITASRARGGINYFRRRAAPVNPGSARQDVVRSAVATLTAMWSQLSLADWLSWRVYANNVPKTDGLGQEYRPSAIAWFIGANVGRLQTGNQIVTTAPGWFNRAEQVNPESIGIGIEDDAGGITANFDEPAQDAGFVAVYLGRPVNPGVEFFDGPWRLVGTAPFIAEATAVSMTLDEDVADNVWSGPYGPVAIGSQQRLRMVTYYADGRYSSGVQVPVTVGGL